MVQVRHGNLSGNDLHFSRIRSASGTPASTPTSVKGEVYRDESTQELYISNSSTTGDYTKIKLDVSELITGFTLGSVIFAGSSGALSQNNSNFFWDNNNNQLLLGNGSATNPSFSFGSDADVGVYRVSANTLGLAVGGVARFTLSDSTATLSRTGADNTLVVSTTTSGNPVITLDATGTNNGSLRVARSDGGSLNLTTTGNNVLKIGASGGSSASVTLNASTSAFTGGVPDSTSVRAIIHPNGVGIGNITPSYPLDINGTMSARASVGTASSTRLVAQRTLTLAGTGVAIDLFNITVPAGACTIIVNMFVTTTSSAGGPNSTTFLASRSYVISTGSGTTSNGIASTSTTASAVVSDSINGTGGTGSFTNFVLNPARTSTTNVRLSITPTYTTPMTGGSVIADILIVSGNTSGFSVASV